MSQQSLFIADGTGSNNVASVTAQNTADGGFSLQSLVAQYNSAAPTLTSGALSFLQTDVNGALKVTFAASADGDAANPGSALPAQTSWIGASDGSNLRGLLVESSSAANLRTGLYYGATEMIIGLDGYTSVHALQGTSPWVVSGTVAATQSGTWTVQQGTPPWTVIGTTATGSAAGNAVQGLVAQYNSSAPTLTNGTVNFLQTDVNGNLKVTFTASSDSDAGAPGAAAPSQATYLGASDGTNLQGLMVESSTALNLRSSLYYGATEMKIANDGYTAVHQADSPWVVSGTVTANQGTSPWVVSGTVAATQSGTWTVQQGTPPWTVIGTTATNTAAGNTVQVTGAEFLATGAASAVAGPVDGYRFAGTLVTSGNATFAQTDGYGRLEMSPARAIAYAYENRASQTVTLKNTAGVLRKVIVGNAGATGALVTVYDSTSGSGQIIAKFNPSSVLGQLSFDIPFANGLTYVTNAKVPGDVTITFE